MIRSAFLLPLVLAACAPEFPPEIGALPRPMPPGMQITVTYVPDAQLQATATAEAAKKTGGDHLWARTFASPQTLTCRIEISDALSSEEREYALTHERRHCTGQKHVAKIINGKRTLVWLP